MPPIPTITVNRHRKVFTAWFTTLIANRPFGPAWLVQFYWNVPSCVCQIKPSGFPRYHNTSWKPDRVIESAIHKQTTAKKKPLNWPHLIRLRPPGGYSDRATKTNFVPRKIPTCWKINRTSSTLLLRSPKLDGGRKRWKMALKIPVLVKIFRELKFSPFQWINVGANFTQWAWPLIRKMMGIMTFCRRLWSLISLDYIELG